MEDCSVVTGQANRMCNVRRVVLLRQWSGNQYGWEYCKVESTNTSCLKMSHLEAGLRAPSQKLIPVVETYTSTCDFTIF